MRRWPILVALLLLPGCGVQPTGRIYAGDPAVAMQPVPPTTIYFVRGKRLFQVARPSVPGAPQAAIDQLVAGPSKAEMAAGVRTMLPNRRVEINVWYGEADIDLGASGLSRLALAQLVCTAQAQPNVQKVDLTTYQTERTITCDSFSDLRTAG